MKNFKVAECPLHANQDCILKRIIESFKKLFSMKSETDDGRVSCSNFPERSTDTKLADKNQSYLR